MTLDDVIRQLHVTCGPDFMRNSQTLAKLRKLSILQTTSHLNDVLRGREQMQTVYLVLSSSGSSPWKITNSQGMPPMNIGVSVACNSTSAWQIDYTVDDITGTYPNPTLGASAPTIFSSFNGSSSAYASFVTPVAAIRLTLNSLSSIGAKVTATILQSGIG